MTLRIGWFIIRCLIGILSRLMQSMRLEPILQKDNICVLRHISIAFTCAILTFTAVPAFAAAPITGSWYTDGKRAIVNVAPCGTKLCGKITRFIEKPKDNVTTDVNNPDPQMRKRKLIGLPVLSEFSEDGTQWRGQIYDPEHGKTYRSVVYKAANGNLIVKGCIGPFCKSQTWTAAR